MTKLIITLVNLSMAISCFGQTQLWGITTYGGEFDDGTIFRTDADGNNPEIVYSFSYIQGGYSPDASLVQAANGKLYGTATGGGAFNLGVIFEFDRLSNVYTQKYEFDGPSGNYPNGPIMLASNGKLYGMTWWGGENDEGVIYEFDPITGTYTKKFDFLAGTYGAEPWGGLIELSGGKLYGMTVYGGSNYDGVIFEFDIYTNAFEVKYNFIGDVTGHSPVGTLTLASNGKIYGLTELGGNYGSGVLFEFDPVTNETVSLVHFYGPEKGSYPRGTLLQATNGKLYGMTYQGGYISPEIQENGVFFEFDLDTYTYTKILDFDGSNGKNPYGYIMEASNGNLYAVTKNGGANGKGVMFEYNLQTGVFTKKFDFDGSNGSRPEWNCLIELPNNVGIEDGATDLRINISPNPCKETFTVETTFDYNEDIRIIMQNVLGETVWMLTETVAAGFYTKQINTRDLSEGLYFLSVATSDKLIVKRIIKN